MSKCILHLAAEPQLGGIKSLGLLFFSFIWRFYGLFAFLGWGWFGVYIDGKIIDWIIANSPILIRVKSSLGAFDPI